MFKTCTNDDCGKFFNGFSEQSLCPGCQKQKDKDYDILRVFIRDNPGMNLVAIHEATGVSTKTIIEMVNEGHFSAVSCPTCSQCGKAITPNAKGGRCDSCLKDLGSRIKPTMSPDKGSGEKAESSGDKPAPSPSSKIPPSNKERTYGLGRH